MISREGKQELYSYVRVAIPTLVYGSEVLEKMCLRSICDIRRVNGVRNAIIRERCGCELSVLERIERNVLKWFRHVEKKKEIRTEYVTPFVLTFHFLRWMVKGKLFLLCKK